MPEVEIAAGYSYHCLSISARLHAFVGGGPFFAAPPTRPLALSGASASSPAPVLARLFCVSPAVIAFFRLRVRVYRPCLSLFIVFSRPARLPRLVDRVETRLQKA